MRPFERRGGVPATVLARADLPRGERALAHAEANDGSWVLGTRRSLVLLLPDTPARVIAWEQVEDARWDREASQLVVSEIGTYGEQRPSYVIEMEDPALLLQLVRERVTASVVLQRWAPVRGRLGLTVIGRRSPAGGPVRWMHAYDAGIDPDDRVTVAVADQTLEAVRAEVGDSGTPEVPSPV